MIIENKYFGSATVKVITAYKDVNMFTFKTVKEAHPEAMLTTTKMEQVVKINRDNKEDKGESVDLQPYLRYQALDGFFLLHSNPSIAALVMISDIDFTDDDEPISKPESNRPSEDMNIMTMIM
jgi:hypothetical protein